MIPGVLRGSKFCFTTESTEGHGASTTAGIGQSPESHPIFGRLPVVITLVQVFHTDSDATGGRCRKYGVYSGALRTVSHAEGVIPSPVDLPPCFSVPSSEAGGKKILCIEKKEA